MLAMQPDFGQSALILFGWGVMYFIAGAPMVLLVALAGVVVFGGTVAYANSEHFARRIDGFLNPMWTRPPSLATRQTRSARAAFSALAWGRGR